MTLFCPQLQSELIEIVLFHKSITSTIRSAEDAKFVVAPVDMDRPPLG